MRILIFGDSIAQGFWDEAQGGWVHRLRAYYDSLQVKDFSHPQPKIFNLGVSGDTAADILDRFEAETLARQWPGEALMLIFAVGTNDSKIIGSQNYCSTDAYKAHLSALLEKVPHFTKLPPIFVGLTPCDETRTTPVSWVDVSYENGCLQAFDRTLQATVEKHGGLYVPVFEKFQAAQAKKDLLFDGLHPNAAGHTLLAELVRPSIDQLLKNPQLV